jgi:hypothetical protein
VVRLKAGAQQAVDVADAARTDAELRVELLRQEAGKWRVAENQPLDPSAADESVRHRWRAADAVHRGRTRGWASRLLRPDRPVRTQEGVVGKAAIAKRALDRAVRARLWEESEGLTNIVWPGVAQ